jgi:hypothetical protein
MTAAGQRQGFLALNASAGTTIDNVYVQVTMNAQKSGAYCAGLISYCDSATIKNCVFDVAFNGADNAYVIAAERFVNMKVSNVYAISAHGTSTNSAINLSGTASALVAKFFNSATNTYVLPEGFNSYWNIDATTGAFSFGSATIYTV